MDIILNKKYQELSTIVDNKKPGLTFALKEKSYPEDSMMIPIPPPQVVKNIFSKNITAPQPYWLTARFYNAIKGLESDGNNISDIDVKMLNGKPIKITSSPANSNEYKDTAINNDAKETGG